MLADPHYLGNCASATAYCAEPQVSSAISRWIGLLIGTRHVYSSERCRLPFFRSAMGSRERSEEGCRSQVSTLPFSPYQYHLREPFVDVIILMHCFPRPRSLSYRQPLFTLCPLRSDHPGLDFEAIASPPSTADSWCSALSRTLETLQYPTLLGLGHDSSEVQC